MNVYSTNVNTAEWEEAVWISRGRKVWKGLVLKPKLGPNPFVLYLNGLPQCLQNCLITQAVRPGFRFRLFFPLVQSQIALWCLTRMRHVCMRSTWNLQKSSSWKVGKDSFISRAMKSFPNEHTVLGRPTLKDVKRFRNGSSPSITRELFTSEPFQLIYQGSSYSKRD